MYVEVIEPSSTNQNQSSAHKVDSNYKDTSNHPGRVEGEDRESDEQILSPSRPTADRAEFKSYMYRYAFDQKSAPRHQGTIAPDHFSSLVFAHDLI